MGQKASKSEAKAGGKSKKVNVPPLPDDAVNRALECPVCLDLYRDPVVLPCCGQSACTNCLVGVSNCPLCAAALASTAPLAKNRVLAQVCEEYSKKQAMATSTNQSLPCPPSSSSKPSLQRQSSVRQCLICMDPSVGALVCNNNHTHAVCSQCFPPYVKSICEDAGKFKDVGFVIRCPEPSCKAKKPWNTAEVTSCLLMSPDKKEVLDMFINSLVKAAHRVEQQQEVEDENTTNVQRLIAEALCVKCPSRFCRTILDAEPDGCCAMRCTRCGTHFCWLCLKSQSSSSAAHDHVRKCPLNPQKGQLFLPKADKTNAQRAVRLENIQKKLVKRLGDKWKEKPDVVRAIRGADVILEGTEICPEDIISGSLRPLPGPLPVRNPQRQPNPAAGNGGGGQQMTQPQIVYIIGSVTVGFICCYVLFVKSPSPTSEEAESQQISLPNYFNPFYYLLIVPSFYFLYLQLMQHYTTSNWQRALIIVASVIAAVNLPLTIYNFCYYIVGFLFKNVVSLVVLSIAFQHLSPALIYSVAMLSLQCLLGHFLYSLIVWIMAAGITLVVCNKLRIVIPRWG